MSLRQVGNGGRRVQHPTRAADVRTSIRAVGVRHDRWRGAARYSPRVATTSVVARLPAVRTPWFGWMKGGRNRITITLQVVNLKVLSQVSSLTSEADAFEDVGRLVRWLDKPRRRGRRGRPDIRRVKPSSSRPLEGEGGLSRLGRERSPRKPVNVALDTINVEAIGRSVTEPNPFNDGLWGGQAARRQTRRRQ